MDAWVPPGDARMQVRLLPVPVMTRKYALSRSRRAAQVFGAFGDAMSREGPITTIILPENFEHHRYGGLWLDYRHHWDAECVRLLCASIDLGISCDAAANTIGRPPSALAHKAKDLGLSMPRDWWNLIIKRKRSVPVLNLEYPYVVKPTKEHDDLLAVNRMVSRAMPGREDVVQDVMLALWETRTSLTELRADPRALQAFVRSFRKASFERSGYGVESMDVTIHSEDGDGKSKYEDARYQRTLADPDDQFIEDNIFLRGRHTNDFSDKTIVALSNEEEALGVPAAFWARMEAQQS